MYDYDQAIKYYNDGLEAKLKYELLRRLYHHKREYVKAIETYDKAIKIRRRVQSESHTTLESIVYTRNALQEYVQ